MKVTERSIEIIGCPFCKSNRAQEFRKSADIVKCLNCKTVYLRTRLTKESMMDLYEYYDRKAPQMFLPRDDKAIENSFLRRDGWLLEILSHTKEKDSILDVGCGWGAFLDNARRYGLTPYGIELTKNCVEFARTKLNIEVKREQLTEADFDKTEFNIITMNHVLEHLPEPKESLRKVYSILKPGGLFSGIVPNIESLSSRFLLDHWEWLDADYHYVHYDLNTLKYHLESCGFEIVKLYTVSGDYNRQQLMEVITKHYRAHNGEMISDIVSSIEKSGLGEEIRFIARKPINIVAQNSEHSKVYNSLKEENVLTSIIIPVHNKLTYTQQCIQTLYTINSGTNSFEIIIVDNASSDNTSDFLKFALTIYPNLTVIRNEQNLSFSKACNIGAKKASGKYLIFLNNDTIPLENWISNGLSPFQVDTSVGIVGTKLLYPDKTIQHAGIEFMSNMHPQYSLWPVHRYKALEEYEPLANIQEEVDAVTGACLFISLELFNQVGGFSEEFEMYFEDTDLCFKVKEKAKKIIYQPSSAVIHFEGKSNNDEVQRHLKNSKSAEKFYMKWKDTLDLLIKQRNAFSISPIEDATLLEDYQNLESNRKLYVKYLASGRTKEAEKVAEGIISLTKKINHNDMLNAKNSYHRTSGINNIEISIIVPTYNNLNFTKEFVKSLYKQTKMTYELIVIDNCSSDGTINFLNMISIEKNNVIIIKNSSNLGFPSAVNQGIVAASGKFILVANNDIVFTSGWLSGLIEKTKIDKNIGIVGPESNYISGPQMDKEAVYKDLTEMSKYARNKKKSNEGVYEIFPRVAFLCTLIKREVIEKIGGLDERFSPGNFEDDDFCLRAQLAGYKTVIAKDVFIHHYGSKSFKANGDKAYDDLIERNRKKFIDKWGADPEDIWIKGKPVKQRSIKYPVHSDKFIQSFERALIHIGDNEYQYAANELDNAVSEYYSSERVGYNIEYSDVIDLRQKINNLIHSGSGSDIQTMLNKLEALMNEGEFEKAGKYIESILVIDKENPVALNNQAVIRIQNKEYESALQILEKILIREPDNEIALNNLQYLNENI